MYGNAHSLWNQIYYVLRCRNSLLDELAGPDAARSRGAVVAGRNYRRVLVRDRPDFQEAMGVGHGTDLRDLRLTWL